MCVAFSPGCILLWVQHLKAKSTRLLYTMSSEYYALTFVVVDLLGLFTVIPVVTPSIISCPCAESFLSLFSQTDTGVSDSDCGLCRAALDGDWSLLHSMRRALRLDRWATALFTHGSMLLSLIQLLLVGDNVACQSSRVMESVSEDWDPPNSGDGTIRTAVAMAYTRDEVFF